MPVLALTGKARFWEPRRLRFRLFSAAAQLATQRLKVTWKSGVIKNEITFKVKAGAKGHDQEDGTIVKVAV